MNTPKFSLKIGEDCKSSICQCCDRKSFLGHGFIYKNGDAYAVYYAGWSPSHAEKKVSFAIATGEWDDNSTVADRTCFGLEAYDANENIIFRLIEPVNSPWNNTELLGKMISRDNALSNPLKKEVFDIVEYVIHNHNSIKKYLGVSS